MFKFSIERETLLSSLLLVIGAVERRSALPILSNVLLDVSNNGLTLTGTDTEIELTSRLAISSIEEEGKITVPARKFIDICRSLDDGAIINLVVKNDRVMVSSGRSRFALMSLPADDFPSVSEEPATLEFKIETKSFIDLLQVTHFAMAQQDVRFYLNGLLLELLGDSMSSVCTDGHRLSVANIKLNSPIIDSKMILPRKAVLELLRLTSDITDEYIHIQQTDNHFYLKTEKYQFISKLVSGKFPNYRKVLQIDNDKHFLVDRDLFKQTLSRVSILANEKYRAVTLNMSERKLVIDAVNKEQEEAVEELEVDTQGEDISIGVNASYILDVLNSIPPGLVKVSLSEPNRSILLESSVLPIAKYIIMPMKI